METEPNLPNRPNGELPSQYGQEQQHSSTSPPVVALVVLLAGGSGLIYYTTVYQPNLKHAQATATALVQIRATAHANATNTAHATATGIVNANATATATVPTPIVEDTSGAPCDKSFPAGTNPSSVGEQCPRAQYTIHLGSSDELEARPSP